jgi:hypothetical protein
MGGVTVAQDPHEAALDSMPASALSPVEIDQCVSLYQMGPLLIKIAKQPLPGLGRAAPMTGIEWQSRSVLRQTGTPLERGL